MSQVRQVAITAQRNSPRVPIGSSALARTGSFRDGLGTDGGTIWGAVCRGVGEGGWGAVRLVRSGVSRVGGEEAGRSVCGAARGAGVAVGADLTGPAFIGVRTSTWRGGATGGAVMPGRPETSGRRAPMTSLLAGYRASEVFAMRRSTTAMSSSGTSGLVSRIGVGALVWWAIIFSTALPSGNGTRPVRQK